MAQGQGSVVLIGSRHSAGTLALQEFLTRNSQPYTYLDVDHDADVQETLDHFGLERGRRARRSSAADDASSRSRRSRRSASASASTGSTRTSCATWWSSARAPRASPPRSTGPPRGSTCWSSRRAPREGRRAPARASRTTSAFPRGSRASDLAGRALVQAEKFGAEFAVARTAVRLACERRPYGGSTWATASASQARTVIIATGVAVPEARPPDLARFEGLGVYYGATQIEATFCDGEDVIVVGGGNSAGQAAVFLSQGRGDRCTCWCAARGLAESMSRYLIRRIEETPNITLRTRTRDRGARGGRPPRARDAGATPAARARRTGDPPRVPDDRRRPQHGLARAAASRSTRRAS